MRDISKRLPELLRWNLLESAALLLSQGDPTFQGVRDQLFRPFATMAIRLGLTANIISVFGLTFAILAAALITQPTLAGVMLAVSLFFDGLDGVVARLTRTAAPRGEIVDIACDTAGILIMMLGLVYWEYLGLVLFALYSFILVTYTLISSAKSKALLGKYRSIGSRVAITSYVAVCLAASQFLPQGATATLFMNEGLLFLTMLLGFNLLWDCFGFAFRWYCWWKQSPRKRLTGTATSPVRQ